MCGVGIHDLAFITAKVSDATEPDPFLWDHIPTGVISSEDASTNEHTAHHLEEQNTHTHTHTHTHVRYSSPTWNPRNSSG